MAETPERPDAAELVPVDGNEWVFRVIKADYISINDQQGKLIQRGAFTVDEFKPTSDSYGASVYVESKMGDFDTFCATLLKEVPHWKGSYFARIPVHKLARFSITVRYSPQDCDIQALEGAHASLTKADFNRTERNALLDAVQEDLHRNDSGEPVQLLPKVVAQPDPTT